MTLAWLILFWVTGSHWVVTLGFGDAKFSTAGTWLVICIALDLAGGVGGSVHRS
jgi:hypothetical protein